MDDLRPESLGRDPTESYEETVKRLNKQKDLEESLNQDAFDKEAEATIQSVVIDEKTATKEGFGIKDDAGNYIETPQDQMHEAYEQMQALFPETEIKIGKPSKEGDYSVSFKVDTEQPADVVYPTKIEIVRFEDSVVKDYKLEQPPMTIMSLTKTQRELKHISDKLYDVRGVDPPVKMESKLAEQYEVLSDFDKQMKILEGGNYEGLSGETNVLGDIVDAAKSGDRDAYIQTEKGISDIDIEITNLKIRQAIDSALYRDFGISVHPEIIRAFVSKNPNYNPVQMTKVRKAFLDTKEDIAKEQLIIRNQRVIQDLANTVMDETSTSKLTIKIPVKTEAKPAHPNSRSAEGVQKETGNKVPNNS